MGWSLCSISPWEMRRFSSEISGSGVAGQDDAIIAHTVLIETNGMLADLASSNVTKKRCATKKIKHSFESEPPLDAMTVAVLAPSLLSYIYLFPPPLYPFDQRSTSTDGRPSPGSNILHFTHCKGLHGTVAGMCIVQPAIPRGGTVTFASPIPFQPTARGSVPSIPTPNIARRGPADPPSTPTHTGRTTDQSLPRCTSALVPLGGST